MTYSYENFINEINSGKIQKISFSIKDYFHYRNCRIERGQHNWSNCIIVTLTNDNSEGYEFFYKFNEKCKLFKIGNAKTLTLKQIWDRVEISSIEYK